MFRIVFRIKSRLHFYAYVLECHPSIIIDYYYDDQIFVNQHVGFRDIYIELNFQLQRSQIILFFQFDCVILFSIEILFERKPKMNCLGTYDRIYIGKSIFFIYFIYFF